MHENIIQTVNEYALEGAELRKKFFADSSENVYMAAKKIVARLSEGGKLFLCGNGGSAADAQHLAAEFVNRFLIERAALPAIALTTDTSALTAIGNDRHFDQVFARQLEALGRKGDILIAISTSGNSPNILNVLTSARSLDIFTIGFSGNGGGVIKELCDIIFDVPSKSTPLIQEIHITVGHLLCHIVDMLWVDSFCNA